MDAARDQEVARALGRRGGQDRGRIFGETDIGHALAHVGDDLGAGDDVPVQRLAAQIEEAVLEAHVFRIIGLAEDRQRQFLGRRQDFDLLGEDLDLAGAEIGVDGVGHAFLATPSMRITHSPRTVSAILKAGESGSATTWVRP
jgi:hypothetical protein